MDSLEHSLLDRLLSPLEPLPTGAGLRLTRLEPKAVIFDVYGTLLISAAGDVGKDAARDSETAFRAALAEGDLAPERDGGAAMLREEINRVHREKRGQNIAYPEVNILRIWSRTLERLGMDEPRPDVLRRIALAYECRINPVWPMPSMLPVLENLLQNGIVLGILSNAQFYTPLLLEYFLGLDHNAFGFAPDLCRFSWLEGEAKPAPSLFAAMNRALAARGIEPGQVLYVGNDMGKDIYPARQAGWQTALFAGDRRSLRLRDDDPRMAAVRPDLIIDRLDQLVRAVTSSAPASTSGGGE